MFEVLAKKISQSMTESEVNQVVHSGRADFNKGLRELSDRVKSGESIDDVISSVREKIHSSILLGIIEEELRDDLSSFIESEYIRNLDLVTFKDFFQYAINNILISKESEKEVASTLQIDRKQFGYLVKFINTVNDLIIIKRFTKNNFSIAMDDLFRLDANKIGYLWDLFDQNKSTLVSAALLSAVTTIKRANNNILFLNELLSSLGED